MTSIKASESVEQQAVPTANRHEQGLSLARDSVWMANEAPFADGDIYDRALALYPALEANEKVAKQRLEGSLDRSFLCSALVELGMGNEAAEYLQFAMESFPEGFPPVRDDFWCFQNILSLTVHSSVNAMQHMTPQGWLASPNRAGLADILSQPMKSGPLRENSEYEHLIVDAFRMPYLANSLLKAGDGELFRTVYEDLSDSLRKVLVREMTDFMAPARVGNLGIQLELLRVVRAGQKTMSPITLSDLTLNFWKGSEALYNCLKEDANLDNWKLVVGFAIETFNIDSINRPMDALKQHKLWEMLEKMPVLLCRAREAGLELNDQDYRASLEPIAKVASLGKSMQWRGPMGDSFDKLKVATQKLFQDIDPQLIFKRALPKHLATAMSEITDDFRWKAKATLTDRSKIFAEDLGM